MKENELRMDNLRWAEKMMKAFVWAFLGFVLFWIIFGAVSC
jgi:hypothetical protein